MKEDELRRRINEATSEDEVRELIDGLGRNWASEAGVRALRRIEAIRHADMKPPVWYKHPATWIAIGSVLISILSWLFPRH